jgi:hypothetical protein
VPSQLGQFSAPLAPISLVADGVKGLNLQRQNELLDPGWATQASNLVFNAEGSLSTRSGWGSPLNATPISGNAAIGQIFEYTPTTGSNVIITAANNQLFAGTTTLTNVTGSLTITANNWKFVNFNGNCYGLQTGHPLIVYNGTGNFTTVTAASGSVPNGNELLSAFGRLWSTDSTGQLLIYSQLLDATNWSVTGAGNFNLTSVWGTGNDHIVALASYNSLLIVFGTRNIVIWADGSGSDLGLNPINAYVYDIVPGIGVVARDSVQNCNGADLAFLAFSGVQSLQRLIIERSNAIKNLSLNVRDSLNMDVAAETQSAIRSTYNAYNGFYLLLLPASGIIYAFDTKLTLDDGSWRVTQWDTFVPTALLTLHDNQTLYGGSAGQLFQYGSTTDNGKSYTATYQSPWLSLGDEIQTRLKMLKRISAIVSYSGTGVLTTSWAYDFSNSFSSYQTTVSAGATSGLWGTSQWGLSTWGSSTFTSSIAVPASGTGQFIKIGLSFPVSGSTMTFLQTQLYAKVGRVI